MRAGFYQDLWTQAAHQIGATVERLHGELLWIARGSATAKVFRNYTDLDGPVTLQAAGNKPLVHQTLRDCGIPTPEFVTFSVADISPALQFLRLHGRCVVKPASGSGAGDGVTTAVRTRQQLIKATISAAAYSEQLLIEKQVSGKNVRLLYLDGHLLDAIERRPPSVLGDGRSTVSRLVREANRDRLKRGSRAAQVFLRRDLDMQRTLANQGLAWRDVPVDGQAVRLKTVINENAATDNVPVADIVCDDIIATGRRAAQAMGIRLAGVDIIARDVTAGLSTADGVVLEINTAPGLYIHQGRPGISVAAPILEASLDQSRQLIQTSFYRLTASPAHEGPSNASSC